MKRSTYFIPKKRRTNEKENITLIQSDYFLQKKSDQKYKRSVLQKTFGKVTKDKKIHSVHIRIETNQDIP